MADEKRFEVLDKVYEEGELFWDSADIYMDSEDLIGEYLQSRCQRVTSSQIVRQMV